MRLKEQEIFPLLFKFILNFKCSGNYCTVILLLDLPFKTHIFPFCSSVVERDVLEHFFLLQSFVQCFAFIPVHI